jgi:hypothetical protein
MYIDLTVPFTNQTQRAKHFRKHGHEFGAVDEFAYEQMADAFMSQPMHPNLYECVNPTGTRDRNRLDAITRCFGVAYNITVIRTMHIRDAYAIQHWGGPQGFVNKKCSEVFI